jgi:dihydrofolate synthase/folylpolyglutamate synthase
MAAIDALRESGLSIGDEAFASGLAGVHWPGRMEVLSEAPLVIADGAHNRESARRFREALRDYFACARATFIVASSSDKDIEGLAEELAPVAERVFSTRTRHPRAMDPLEISARFSRLGVAAEDVYSVETAVALALAASRNGGVICLIGSLFLAAEGRELFLGRAEEL